jgi:hypothetical protein
LELEVASAFFVEERVEAASLFLVEERGFDSEKVMGF